jgi:hypothetical protein
MSLGRHKLAPLGSVRDQLNLTYEVSCELNQFDRLQRVVVCLRNGDTCQDHRSHSGLPRRPSAA